MIAIYARQSVEKKDSISIETQIEKCQAETGSDATIFVDKGFSGKNINRPEFQRMLEQVRSGKIEKIVVYRIDRFSRSIADFGSVWEVLKENGVEFVSINEKFDTSTPIGRAMLYIVMSFAQLERETIAERIKDNYYARLQNGTWVGGPAPFGFSIKNDKSNGKKVSILQANDDIEIVKKIYLLYMEKEKSLGDIAMRLTEEKIPCGKRKAWDSVAVSRILHNPIYARCDFDLYTYLLTKGIQINGSYKGFDGIHGGMLVGKRDRGRDKYNQVDRQYFSISLHEGIIPSEIWIRCNEKLDENKQVPNNGKGKYTWLSGLLKCQNCGYSLKIVFSKGKKYLVCSGRTNYHICHEKIGVWVEQLELEVQKEIEKTFPKIQISENNLGENELNLTEKVLSIDKKISRLVEAITQSDYVPIQYLNEKIKRLEEEKNLCLTQMGENKKSLNKKQFNFEALTFEEKKIFASEVIEKIMVGNDNAEVQWKI
ncbi:MAG: recombinase family protein [Lachnospiraceae bacterium]|nr:recombinase family protein [Lachnospiraceae bacterium]